MKNKLLILTLTAGLISTNLTAQTILKKKEVSEKLILISSEIENKYYENAMNILFSKESIILLENVKGKDIEKYNNQRKILEAKKIEFDNTKSTINTLIQSYQYLNFDKALELIEMPLTKENSYKETQKTQSEILPQLKYSKTICEKNKENIFKWEQDFQNQEYEKLFKIIDLKNSAKDCFYKADLIELEKLQKEIQPKYQIYKTVKSVTVTNPRNTINNINYNYLNYEQSESYIEKLTTLFNVLIVESQKLSGKNLLLINEISETKFQIENELVKLGEFSELNKPLTQAEINSLFTSSKSISLEKLKEYSDELKSASDILKIYELDVFRHYHLTSYDTDLKKKVFMQSNEYKEKKQELIRIRSELLNSFYYITLVEKFNETEYNITKKGFEIEIGSNFGLGTYMARPPKSIKDFLFLSLPINKYKDNWLGEGVYHEKLFLLINEQKGLSIEENKDDIVIYLFFKIAPKTTVQYQYLCSMYGWYKMSSEILTTKNVKVIVVNKNTNEIYYDKIY